MKCTALFASLALAIAAHTVSADPIERKPFGETTDHLPVEQITLTNKSGISAKIITYGAIVTNLFVPDKNGKIGDIVLGCDSVKQYEETSPYFGCIPGRFAGRIANASFKLGDHEYPLMANSGTNSMHGGFKGYSKRVWTADTALTSDGPCARLTLLDPDGSEGFPGNVHVAVYFTATNARSLKIQYFATTDHDTPINLTHHSYFNLRDAGKTDVLGYLAKIYAERYLPVAAAKIPTGEIATVNGTPFDFTLFKTIGRDMQQLGTGGYDHTLVLTHPPGIFSKAAEIYDPESGRLLECWTTEPGLQFTTCNGLNEQPGKDGAVYGHSAAFCLEAQHFPDSPNRPEFPTTLLHPGNVYHQVTEYRFSIPATPPTAD